VLTTKLNKELNQILESTGQAREQAIGVLLEDRECRLRAYLESRGNDREKVLRLTQLGAEVNLLLIEQSRLRRGP
jgi:hypothetical protein